MFPWKKTWYCPSFLKRVLIMHLGIVQLTGCSKLFSNQQFHLPENNLSVRVQITIITQFTSSYCHRNFDKYPACTLIAAYSLHTYQVPKSTTLMSGLIVHVRVSILKKCSILYVLKVTLRMVN